ncbi:MAG: DUF167 domain-containing protein [Thermoleophilia bacterium]
MDAIEVRQADGEMLVGFRVSPSARRTRVQGRYGGRIKVQVSAPPEDDKANGELVAAVAGWLALPPGSISIRSGHKSRDKLLAFKGIDEPSLRVLLGRLVARTSSD